jgi:hypothetical protein
MLLFNALKHAFFGKDLDVGDVHVATALGNEKPKRKPRQRVNRREDFTFPLDITKVEPDQNLIFGWASVVEENGELAGCSRQRCTSARHKA